MSTPDTARLRELLNEATGVGQWHWSGNTDTDEPYLATWIAGQGRTSVLAIGSDARETTGRQADEVRKYARESGLDPEREVEMWATDNYGEPIQEARLWFYSDGMADPARDNVVYEVAPEATSRDDVRVYRADITDIRHPDAALIVAAVNALPDLLDIADEHARLVERLREMPDEMNEVWGGHRSWLTTGAHVAKVVRNWLNDAINDGGDA